MGFTITMLGSDCVQVSLSYNWTDFKQYWNIPENITCKTDLPTDNNFEVILPLCDEDKARVTTGRQVSISIFNALHLLMSDGYEMEYPQPYENWGYGLKPYESAEPLRPYGERAGVFIWILMEILKSTMRYPEDLFVYM